jgi:hypothetical protein
MTLDEANAIVAEYHLQLPALIDKSILVDIDFWKSELNTYQFVVIDDALNSSKEEPPYCTMVPLSFFVDNIKSPLDILVQYIHVMGHEKCRQLWLQSIAPRRLLSRDEIDFVEEIYNQRLFSVVAPSVYDPFYQSFVAYEKVFNWTHPDLRMILNTLLTQTPHPNVPPPMIQIHSYLYSNDPLDQNTFDRVMWMWIKLLTTSSARELIQLSETRQLDVE